MLLPYPDYSWSLSQHISKATQNEMYELLQAAFIYADDPNYRLKINDYLVQQHMLSPNIRADSGQSDIWRDYQQILSEIGLITSTFFVDRIRVAPIGLLWLDGLIGYSEMMTTQALSYQYPNGHKHTIQAQLKSSLELNQIPMPSTRTELDTIYGIQIKPGILILRILLTLLEHGEKPSITTRECLSALVPIKTNNEWSIALANLFSLRKNPPENPQNPRGLRHVQEWFRFLSFTDIFEIEKDFITFSELAKTNIASLYDLCTYHEKPEHFWIPPIGERQEVGLSWFNYYGNPNLQMQWLIPSFELDQDYVVQNYPKGIEDIDKDDTSTLNRNKLPDINLQIFEARFANQVTQKESQLEFSAELAALRIERQQESTRLHERIVSLLAQRLISRNFEVYEDRNSVDLLASKQGYEIILEVKTITKRNVDRHIRLGVGQLSEYRYRRQINTSNRPEAILVLSTTPIFPTWQVDYFKTDVELGLITLDAENGLIGHTGISSENAITD